MTVFGNHHYTTTTYTANVPGSPQVTIVEVTDGPPGHGATRLATFTSGARTVSLRGPQRSFSEQYVTKACAYATLTLTTSAYVRFLPAPFNGQVDQSLDDWLTAGLNDSSADVIAVAMEYLGDGAQYGPIVDDGTTETCELLDDGTRQAGSDYNDFLGITIEYGEPDGRDRPEADQLGCLDCSGYVRMVFGYRCGLPLSLAPNGTALPRRAVQIYESAPGVMIVDQLAADTQVLDFSRILPGDLVFFNNDPGDDDVIDHVGIYLDRDAQGHYRFISSRKQANGPTFADTGGRSTLNGKNVLGQPLVTETFHYPRYFRAVRRV